MIVVSPSHDLASIGTLCADLQQARREIEQACELLKIEPALRLNGVLHFNAEQAAKIAQHFREAVR